jgi:glutaredoxin
MARSPIVLYATAHCPHCAAARAALRAVGEDFVERDPSLDACVLKEMLAFSAAAVVPTIVVGGRALVGFDAGRLEELLREPPVAPAPGEVYSEEELSGRDDDVPVDR